MRRSVRLGLFLSATLPLLATSPPESLAASAGPHIAPLRLTTSDGSGLALTVLDARAVVDDPLALTELHLTFHNPEPRQREGRFEVTLPEAATITRFAMRIGDGWREGEVVEREQAREAYEDVLHKRQDPALLESDTANRFAARVFPIAPSGDVDLIVTYVQEMPRAQEPYRLPLVGLPEIGKLSVRARVGRRALERKVSALGAIAYREEVVELSRERFAPREDFVVQLPHTTERIGLRAGDLAVTRIVPVAKDAPDPLADLLILVDTSASRALDYAAELRAVADLGREIARTRPGMPITVAAFDQEVEEVYDGPAGQLDARTIDRLTARRALGASSLSGALAWAAARRGHHKRVLLVTDGVATLGETEASLLARRVRALAGSGAERLDVVAVGGLRDRPLLAKLVAGNLRRDGALLDGETAAQELVRRIDAATFSGVRVSVPGSRWSWPQRLDGVQPGDQVLVWAELPASAPLEIRLSGAPRALDDGAWEVALGDASRPLVERAAARTRLASLAERRAALDPQDQAKRAAISDEMVRRSKAAHVACDATSFLVLEREEDYARYGIDRRAADVLAVGPSGPILIARGQMPKPVVEKAIEESEESQTWKFNGEYWRDELGHYRKGKGEAAKGDKKGLTIVTKPPGAQVTVDGKSARGLRAGADEVDHLQRGKHTVTHDPTPQGTTGERLRSLETRTEALREQTRNTRSRLEMLHEQGAVSERELERAPRADTPRDRRGANDRGGQAQPDNDHDGIPDVDDRCPTEPENYNGFEDTDGCPDRGRIVVSSSSLVILDKIYFLAGSTTLQPVSLPIVDAIAATLTGNPSIRRIEIAGHVDERGPVAKNAQLAAQRAEALRAALIARGVQPERLVARGYGAERPVCGQHNAACWARNRRVELTILERAEEPSRQAPVAAESPRDVPPPIAPPPGKLGEIESAIQSGAKQSALAQAFVWHDQEPGDTLALVALGEAAEAIGDPRTAARAYGSIIDLYPGRADLRRYAGERLEHLGADGLALAIDTYAKARAERPDHPSSHRLHAFALLRAGRPSEAFAVLADGLQRKYPDNRFLGVERVLREDAGLVAAAWIAKQPNLRDEILRRATALGVKPPTKPSLRFVLNWETDANDVDLHVWDEAGRHAWYAHKDLGSGGALYADVTTGYGPECFTIEGAPHAFPYKLRAHYYRRGPMGYGMGKLEVIEHDGHGQLRFDERPFVLLVDGGDVDLGTVSAPLMAQAAAHK